MSTTASATRLYNLNSEYKFENAQRILAITFLFGYLINGRIPALSQRRWGGGDSLRVRARVAKGVPMRELFPGKWSTPWVFAALLTALICAVSIYVLFFPLGKNQLAPAVPVISACKELAPGMRRIGNRYGIQFDVPKNEFTFGEGRSDAGPLVGGFDLSTKNGHSLLVISTRRPLENVAIDPVRVMSKHVEKRTILDDKGLPIGEDNWGYLSSGERWRKVQFQGMVAARYSLVSETEARLFDQVINSACFLPAP